MGECASCGGPGDMFDGLCSACAFPRRDHYESLRKERDELREALIACHAELDCQQNRWNYWLDQHEQHLVAIQLKCECLSQLLAQEIASKALEVK